MAGGPSILVANYLLNKSLKDTNFTVPSTFYVALIASTAEAALRANNIAGAGELAVSNGYSRKPVLASQIVVATDGVSVFTDDIVFDAATGQWSTIYQAALMDSSVAGNVWYFGPLGSAASLQFGDILTLPAGDFAIYL
jgi:hypothetical protein